MGYVDRGALPGAVLLIARATSYAYVEAIGYQDRETKTAMKEGRDLSRLASMTKPIVFGGGDDARRGGKLDLIKPVAAYLAGVQGSEGRGRGNRPPSPESRTCGSTRRGGR